jgi:Ricin-type beta-trefoil lectin domain-like/Vacuolar protein sorting-associated protein 62
MRRTAIASHKTALTLFALSLSIAPLGCAEQPGDDADREPLGASAEAAEALETYASPFNLIAAVSGKCVTVEASLQLDNANIRQWACDDADKRKWSLDATGDGYYRLIARHSGKCMDVVSASTADGADVNQWTCNSSDEQKFKLIPAGNGYYTLVAKHSGKCIDIPYSSTADGADIWQWSCNGTSAQRFQLARTETTGNLLYGRWSGSGGRSATSAGNPSFMVDYVGPTRPVTFELSSGTDTYLYLLDGNGNVIAEDDDSLGNLNSRVTFTLATGTYKLVAATYDPGKVNEFGLSSNLANLRFPQNLYVQPASRFTWIYDDAGTGADHDISIWRPDLSQYPGYYSLGDVAMPSHGAPPRASFVVKGDGDLLAQPVDYTSVWADHGSGGKFDVTFWEPVAPAGYTCLGHVAVGGYYKPSTDLMRCIKSAYVLSANSAKIWDDAGSGATDDVSVWEATTKSYRSLPTSTFISRPSHPDNGGAGRYWALNKSATASDELRGGAVTGLTAATFAPRIWLDGGENYFPSSTSFFLPNVNDTNGFLVTKQSLGCNNCTDPAFLDGQRPDQNRVPVYAEIVKRNTPGIDTTDILYWTFYPYNNGKVVCVGDLDPLLGCIGDRVRFGNHVGDWEHMTVRFIDGRPADVSLAQHDSGQRFTYGEKYLGLAGFHETAYAAQGSHGLYPNTGRHIYKDLPNGDYLADYTSTGMAWDTWKTVVPFAWQSRGTYTGALSFLNIESRWGNPKSGCGFWEAVSGECVLNDGPEAPMVKGFAAPSFTDLQ